MIAWRRGWWWRLGWALSTASVARWSRRATYFGLAIGLVLMHHVVGAHQHKPGEPTPGGAAAPAAAAAAAAPAAAAAGPVAAVAAPVAAHTSLVPSAASQEHAGNADAEPAPASGAALHHHDSDGDDAAVMVLLHMCLAVLAAVTVLTALGLIASWWRTAPRHRPATWARTVSLARPPPVPLRLAQLQILRL